MKIDPYLIASALVGIVAQRLVRKICPKCKEVQQLSESYLKVNRLPADITYYHGTGCEFCKNTGFSGRVGIYEILKFNDELREAVSAGAPQHIIKELAINNGMRLLADSGLDLARNGVTTIDEVLRVTAFK
jgi:type IV pilus assembly protein PilB